MSYTNFSPRRYSPLYRFTTTDINDPQIEELRALLKQLNVFINRYNAYQRASFKECKPTYGIRVRPRGSRAGNYTGWGNCYAYDTPIENATHFDVYVREYRHR